MNKLVPCAIGLYIKNVYYINIILCYVIFGQVISVEDLKLKGSKIVWPRFCQHHNRVAGKQFITSIIITIGVNHGEVGGRDPHILSWVGRGVPEGS